MIPLSTDTKVNTVTSENYIDVKYEYYGVPDDSGLRLRTRDVWFATKPTVPEFHIVDKDDEVVPEFEANVSTGWSIGKAGLQEILIVDLDDINGLRALLDTLEQEFEIRAMAELTKEFNDSGSEEEDVDDA